MMADRHGDESAFDWANSACQNDEQNTLAVLVLLPVALLFPAVKHG